MPQCQAVTKRLTQCQIDANPDRPWCHMHDPLGAYRQQHPGLPDPQPYSRRTVAPSLVGVRDWQLA